MEIIVAIATVAKTHPDWKWCEYKHGTVQKSIIISNGEFNGFVKSSIVNRLHISKVLANVQIQELINLTDAYELRLADQICKTYA